MKNKLGYIDELLNDNSKLNEYINNIESEDIAIPQELKNSLISFFKPKEKKTLKEMNFCNIFKVFKIATCTIITLIVWNNILLNPNILYYSDNEKIDKFINELNEFFMTPINLERIDKV